MNKFHDLVKFREILRYADNQDNSNSIKAAHPSTSEWDDEGIYLRDRHGLLIFELREPTLIEDLKATQSEKASHTVIRNTIDQTQTSRAVRTVKKFLATVEVVAAIFAIIIVITGILASSYVFQLNPGFQSAILAIITITVSLLIAALMYWSNRVIYSVLELFAEIAEDVRIIRLKAAAGQTHEEE